VAEPPGRASRHLLGWERGCEIISQSGKDRLRVSGPDNALFAAPNHKDASMEDVATAKPVSSTKSTSGFTGSAFEFPKFGIPNFEMPQMEVPAAFREFAERGVSQAKEHYEKMKSAAEQATDLLEETYSTASKGASEYGMKVIEVARTNTNSSFDFASELMNAKSFSEVVELSSAHARKQFETLTAQTKELAGLAQKVALETAEPIKESVTKSLKKVA
jgi:phasin